MLIILASHAKSVEKLEASVETEQSSPPDTDADIGPGAELDSEFLAQSKEQITAEFLTFSAPEEDEDEAKIDDLLELLKPQRIFLIEQPENVTVIEFNRNAVHIDEQPEKIDVDAEKTATPTEE
ncbi:uncharacterized protein LOC105664807 [Ceratitis capitata]|uniref:uncharacterized protein LOC105664807 n=1 Tax=Ceratitis capitata TaxID=7213 RepID=UPI00061895F3|nr:uncharacterized protein LOC105664807 [Ceratitis capitata]